MYMRGDGLNVSNNPPRPKSATPTGKGITGIYYVLKDFLYLFSLITLHFWRRILTDTENEQGAKMPKRKSTF